MSENVIPFNRPCFAGKELVYIAEAVQQLHVSGNGPFTRRCQAFLEQTLGVPKALLTSSCTQALEMAAILLNIQAGDEFIVPSFTFVSTVNAFVLRGGQPVFADIRRDTLNMDENGIEPLITPRTKAIVVVHYAGVGCNMEAILHIAGRYKLPVVEDNAHGLFGKYRGQYLGTFGALATQSFHETKNVTSGEGGALLINDPGLIERAEIIHEKGTNRSRFFRGMVDKYTWVDIGSSFLPSDITAAFLFAQLEHWPNIQERRAGIWSRYQAGFQDWAKHYGIGLPGVPEDCEQAYHMYYIILPSLNIRQALIAKLKEKRINAVFHYLPLHLSDMGLRLGGRPGDCPVTEDISDRLIRLPFYYDLEPEAQDYVIETVKSECEQL